MTTWVVCVLMCFGTVTPAIWLGAWNQSDTKRWILATWIFASLAPIPPAIAIALGTELSTIVAAAVLCGVMLLWWWYCFDTCLRRILQRGTALEFRRGSFSGATLSLGYPILLVLTSQYSSAISINIVWGVIFAGFLFLLLAWVKASYELVTSKDHLDTLGDRSSIDRMIGSLYTMYVGQAGSSLVGATVLFLDEVPVGWAQLGLAKWQTVIAFTIGLGLLYFTSLRARWLYPGLLSASVVGLISCLWLLLANFPKPNLEAFLIAFCAAYGLFDSVLSNGFWHHFRKPSAKDLLATSLLATSCMVCLYWACGSIADSLYRYGREDAASVFAVWALGWLYYTYGAISIARASDRGNPQPIRTQNSPSFNFAHDSLIVVCAFLIGLIPIAWTARAGSPEPTEGGFVEALGIITAISAALTLVVMGIYSGHLHRKMQQSRADPPAGHFLRMLRQWGSVILLIAIGWVPPFVGWLGAMRP